MRVTAAIVASLTGAAFAYPVLDSSKEINEVPAYGVDPKASAYTAPSVYGPAHSSHSVPKPKHEKPEVKKPEAEKPKTVPAKQKQATEDCISKRGALGLDLSACAKAAFSGSLGGTKIPAGPKAVPIAVAAPAPVADSKAVDLPKPTLFEPQEPQDPTESGVVKNPFVPTVPDGIPDTTEITDLPSILTNPVDTLPLPLNDLANIGDSKQNEEVVNDQTLTLPIGKNLEELLPSGENDPTNPESDPLSFVTGAVEQLQKSSVLPKRHLRQVRPAFIADGTANGDLSGDASADEESASLGLKGNFATSATASESLTERGALSIDDEDEAASLAAAGSFDLATSWSSQLDGSAVKREAQLSLDAVTALLGPLTGAPAKTPGAPAKRDLEPPVADFLRDFKNQFEGQLTTSTSAAANADAAGGDAVTEEMIKRNAQLSLDAVTALLGPLTGAPAKTPGAPAKRQIGLDSLDALLAPVTGAPAPKAGGAPAKRQIGLDTVTGLLAPLTGAPAPGAPAKRDTQFSELEGQFQSIPQPANIHFGPGAAAEKLDIQCIKNASGKCKETKLDDDEPTAPEEQDAFDTTAPQTHSSLDLVTKLLPTLKTSEDSKDLEPTQEKSDILGSITNVVPVPI